MHWTLWHNVAADWSICSYVDRAPTREELAEFVWDADAWQKWLDDHLVVVGLEERPRPRSYGLGRRMRTCVHCGELFDVRQDGAGYKLCSEECRKLRWRAQKRHRRRRECVRKWADEKVEGFLVALEEEWARREGYLNPPRHGPSDR